MWGVGDKSVSPSSCDESGPKWQIIASTLKQETNTQTLVKCDCVSCRNERSCCPYRGATAHGEPWAVLLSEQ